MTHVLIATPTMGGVVKSLYATTLVRTISAIKDVGWSVDFVMLDGSYVSGARNYFANVFLGKPHFTHLVMIDSDMFFDGGIICRLLRSDKAVVAAAYSQRRIDLETFAQAARNPELALADITALALKYTLEPQLESGTRQVRVIDGMCRVNQIGMGCCAIRRDAFEDLRVDPGSFVGMT